MSVAKLAIATGHAMQLFNYCIIQMMQVYLLGLHDQLPWLTCGILYIIYNLEGLTPVF
jgi:hypothetical protein